MIIYDNMTDHIFEMLIRRGFENWKW